jgi:Tfp pilus assembly protein PilZ
VPSAGSIISINLGEDFPTMTQSVAQIEKHTIVTRLSVSIYKMETDQLAKILNLLENDLITDEYEDIGGSQDPEPNVPNEPHSKRQMIIARLFVLINQLDKDTLLHRLRPFQHPNFRWIREYPRLSCYLMVDFASDGKAYRSTIRDISAGGVFIETVNSFQQGQDISLCFTLSEDHEMLPFKIEGKITRIYHDGIGVQYENVTDYQRDIISALIDKIQ